MLDEDLRLHIWRCRLIDGSYVLPIDVGINASLIEQGLAERYERGLRLTPAGIEIRKARPSDWLKQHPSYEIYKSAGELNNLIARLTW